MFSECKVTLFPVNGRIFHVKEYFIVSSVACIFAPSIEFFVAMRLLQGIGGSGGIVLSRSIATDRYSYIASSPFVIQQHYGFTPFAFSVGRSNDIPVRWHRVTFGWHGRHHCHHKHNICCLCHLLVAVHQIGNQLISRPFQGGTWYCCAK